MTALDAERQALVEQCWQPIAYGAAAAFPSTLVDADDRVGAAVVGIVKAALEWDGVRPFRRMASCYAYQAVRNAIRAEYRRRNHERRARPIGPRRCGLDLVDTRDEATPLLPAIDGLPSRQATAIRLWMQGLEYGDIGQEMGTTAAPVSMLLSRGLKRLRRELGVVA